MSKEEPFQTKKIRFRQKETGRQQNATKINKEVLRYTKIRRIRQEITWKAL